jgi:hypothetical protein
MKDFLNKGKKMFGSMTDKVSEELTTRFALVKEVVNGLPVFVSSQKSSKYKTDYDEKHYFVIPFVQSEAGYSLHSMRCLPDHVPEINNLPKRRIFHFPNEHYEASLKHHMLEAARENAIATGMENVSSLEQLANSIDELDRKLTYGMLLVGGLAAIFNPLIGAGIAVKALLPGVGGLLSKYGLRPAGEKLTRSQVEKAAKLAEEQVSKAFAESNTIKVENPILQELELALRTTEQEHDPLLDPNLANGSIPELDSERWRELTEIAIFNVYKDIYQNPKKHKDANLGPEDIRWFSTMFDHMDQSIRV